MAVFAAFAGFAVQAAPAARADTGSEEALFLSLTNSLRASQGLGALSPQGQLTSIARSWSSQMAAAGQISHNPNLPGQVTANWTQLGENVGTGGDVQSIQTAFINSPHHYENLVNGAYNYVGIGVVHGSSGAIFVTVDFMAASGASGSAPAPSAPKSTPKATAAPRAAAPAPRVTTARVPTPAVTSPAPAPSSPAPASAAPPETVKVPNSFGFVLERLRTLDR